MNFRQKVRRFKLRASKSIYLGSKSGQALLEYIILLTIVFGVVGIFLQKMTGSFDSATAKFGGSVEQQLRTGAAPPAIWSK